MTKTIMFIDDEKEFTKIFAQTFGARGYTVIEVNSGADALTVLAKTPVDIVTLDLNMPGMDGIEVATRMNKEYPNVKIMVVSGFGGEYDEELKTVKYDAHIPKPVDMFELLKAVPRLLGETK